MVLGFGGSDCGRCSSKREMWPHVNRSINDYDSTNMSRSGTMFAAAACAVMSGLDPDTGPIGNGPIVDLNVSQCTEIEGKKRFEILNFSFFWLPRYHHLYKSYIIYILLFFDNKTHTWNNI